MSKHNRIPSVTTLVLAVLAGACAAATAVAAAATVGSPGAQAGAPGASVPSGASGLTQLPSFSSLPARLIVKYRNKASTLSASAASNKSPAAFPAAASANSAAEGRVQALGLKAGALGMARVKQLGNGAVAYSLGKTMTAAQAHAIAIAVGADPSVQSAEVDAPVMPMATYLPNDPNAVNEWGMQSNTVGGARLFEAWTLTNAPRVTVAVVDTGALSHADLDANAVNGYDMVADPTIAGDGDGHDADPSDPGDYCTSSNSNSSWHGLSVASIIGAIADNAKGIAGGAAYQATVLQIRAMGRCGGYLSDIADGVMWAAGGTIAGAPANSMPARVINVSAGAAAGFGCTSYMQDAVTYAVDHNAVVVAATGNDGTSGIDSPGNCAGVISVGAHSASGDLTGYSNYDASMSLTAPAGGNCKSQTTTCNGAPVAALGNNGTQSPGANSDFVYFAGTSAATPHVASAAALLVATRPDLTPAQVRSILMSTARPHAKDSFCALNPGQCGAGMLDATAALQSVSPPSVVITAPTKSVAGSSAVTLSAVVTGTGAPYTYVWQQTSGPTVTLTGADTAAASFTAPAIKGNDLVFSVTVTASNGVQAVQTTSVKVNNAPVFTSATSATLTEGQDLSLALSATDPDGDAVSYAFTASPAGSILNNDHIEWTKPPVGKYSFTVVATDHTPDGSGDSAPQTITLTVTAATPAPGGNTGGGSGSGSGGGGGGGGSYSLIDLSLLAAMIALLWQTGQKAGWPTRKAALNSHNAQ